MPLEVHFLVPGRLDRKTGGSIYDRRIVDGLRDLGWSVDVRELPGSYPFPDADAIETVTETLTALPDRSVVIVDGLVFGAIPGVVRNHGDRLCLIALVHHPLFDETGLSEEQRSQLFESERSSLAQATGVIVTSRFTRERLHVFSPDHASAYVACPGTAPAPIASAISDVMPLKLLCVASFVPRKGHIELLQALGALKDLPWRLVCVGKRDLDTGHAEAVSRLINDLGLTDRVELYDGVGDETLDRFYDEAHAFVLPSHYEGFGMVITEAIARGLPVVTTTGGALKETAAAGGTLFCEPGDLQTLREVLRRIITEPDLRAELAAKSCQARGSLPTWSDVSSAFADAVSGIMRR